MDYIIAGGAGYVGSHLVSSLVQGGQNRVAIVDDLSTGSVINDWAEFIKFDLRNAIDPKLFKDMKEPVVVNLTGKPDVRRSFAEVEESFSTNVTAMMNVMELARKVNASKVIFMSSAAVYGNAKAIPTPETEDPVPISNYALFKTLNERILKYYTYEYGLHGVAIRLMSVTGGTHARGVVYDIMKRLRADSQRLEIWGDGKSQKSYIYISDVVGAVSYLAQNFKGSFDVFNVGTEDYLGVLEIVELIEKAMNAKPKHEFVQVSGGMGDVTFNFLDINKVKKLGWAPKLNSRQAVQQAIKDLL
ncbi:MAG: NAD-dependent epimerase/dehydratase family protein [Candidatus Micrarchaeota archaeon]|nr:NAD-dependent epimerase/dehydratase family protein [Candidatus Micrarchaeota archaeon]